MTNQANTSMVFFASFRTSIEKIDLPAETKLNYYEAVLDYGLFGTIPHFDNPILEALFEVLMPIIDANTRKKQHAIACAENGKKGGAPQGNTNASKSKAKTTKTTQKTTQETTNNVNVKDNDKVKVNAKVNGKVEKETKDISFISSSSSSKEKKEKAKKEIFLSDEDGYEEVDVQDTPVAHTDSEPADTPVPAKPLIPAESSAPANTSASANTSVATNMPKEPTVPSVSVIPTAAAKPSIPDKPQAPTKPKQSAAPPTAALSIDERNKRFYDSLVPYVDLYGVDAIQSFYDFWVEEDATKQFMKFELEKTWNLEYRLERWLAKRRRLCLP